MVGDCGTAAQQQGVECAVDAVAVSAADQQSAEQQEEPGAGPRLQPQSLTSSALAVVQVVRGTQLGPVQPAEVQLQEAALVR